MTHKLIGLKINSFNIPPDRESISFVTDQGHVAAHCEGDCCSYTWIEGVEEPALGFPATVISVEDLDLPKPSNPSDGEGMDVVAYYGCKITTDKGELLIDFRNNSNGYYGGYLVWNSRKRS